MANGAEALVTFSEINPETAAPTATFAFTAIELFAEHSAVKTPSVMPRDGTVIIPLTTFTPLSMFNVGLHERSNWVWTRESVASPMSISPDEPNVRDPSEQLRAPIDTELCARPAKFMAMLKSVDPRSSASAGVPTMVNPATPKAKERKIRWRYLRFQFMDKI
jgi:hypothetical protein